jgi:hypothetical protein
MSEETRNDIGVVGFLLEIRDKFEVRPVFGLVGCSCERDIHMITGDPFVEVIFNLKAVLAPLSRPYIQKNGLTTVCTNAMVAIGSVSFSENSGCITPSSSLFLNQTLLIIVCIRGARNMPVFETGS